MTRAVSALFNAQAQAHAAIQELRAAGFNDNDIGMVTPRGDSTPLEAAEEQHATAGSRSAEGALAGGAIGGTLGAVLAATGALAIPGVGPFITGGILVAVVGGAAGGLVGGLAGMGVPKEDAQYYEEQVHSGRTLLAVRAEGREAEAFEILTRNGGETPWKRLDSDSDRGPEAAAPENSSDRADVSSANRAQSSGQMADLMRSQSWDGTIPPTAEREAVTAPPNAAGNPSIASQTRLPNDERFNGTNPTDPKTTYDRLEKAPLTPASEPELEPTDADPVPLSPTDPRRRSDEGAPYLDDANPHGRLIPNRQGQPIGGAGLVPETQESEKQISSEG